MERVRMINVQRLLEAAEFLERRDRGNGWTPPPGARRPPAPRAWRECGAAGEGRRVCVCVCGGARAWEARRARCEGCVRVRACAWQGRCACEELHTRVRGGARGAKCTREEVHTLRGCS